jgi:hypothetical protein
MLKMDKIQRLKILKEMIAESPDEPFGYYALLLENEFENPEEILKSWTDLLSKFPDYLPSYYMAGKSFLEHGQKEEAISIWKKGLILAISQGNKHTKTELQSAIQNALIDEDD